MPNCKFYQPTLVNISMTQSKTDHHDPAGSNWRRWDPHIHSPGTTFADQFGGEGSWDEYIERINSATPKIEALGVTDYFRLDGYKRVLEQKRNGKLSGAKFIFPNVELRYGIGSPKGSPINFHLLVSPDDPNHIDRVEDFLQSLTFKAGPNNESFRCTASSIRRLGRIHTNNDNLEDEAAFREGANQFKVNPDEFLSLWADNRWMQVNVLVAVPASSRDGTASLQGDDALAAMRQKLERMSHVIFSSRLSDRKFWLGEGVVSLENIKSTYDGPKPCIHGCDAHSLEEVGQPDLDRYTWIKGDPCFETLRQICIEPKDRVIVASAPPGAALASHTVTAITMENAPWFLTSKIQLNSGLVGIIGARGSGKTALADMIAAGGNSLSKHLTKTSFVKRATQPVNLLGDAAVTLHWADGSETKVDLSKAEYSNDFEPERIQYLSQQFVEQLCSAEGATESLIAEIERVIFNAHPQADRLMADTFSELLEIKASSGRQRRIEYERAIAQAGAKMKAQRDLKDRAKVAHSTKATLTAQNQQDKNALEGLVSKQAEQHSIDFQKVAAAASEVGSKVEAVHRRLAALETLMQEVTAFQTIGADQELDDLKHRHGSTELEDKAWANFKLKYEGDATQEIANAKSANGKLLKNFSGDAAEIKNVRTHLLETLDKGANPSFLPRGVDDLNGLSLALLQAEEERLRNLMELDEDKAKRHKRLSDKMAETVTKIVKLDKTILEAESADAEIKRLLTDRNQSYIGVFEGIIDEEQQLRDLYSPVGDRLEGASGALSKLMFSINRFVDLENWASVGEELIDARATGDFKGKGSLAKVAEQILLPAWQSGDAKEAAEAMMKFRKDYDPIFRQAAKIDKNDKDAYAEWANRISTWLYDTSHITVSYGLQYEGVEIETLSPGTRGIVLLLLYLAIDTDDDRPLLIDQPEENLDPKSIYDELVVLFRNAKLRRQIIIVTHNANLVVNTDADQVIVADCGPLKGGQLPEIHYTSGSLENRQIREMVCQILEGGEQAFRERARRLRID